MGKGDQQRYIKITKIEIIFEDTWRHLAMMTFHLRFPYNEQTYMQKNDILQNDIHQNDVQHNDFQYNDAHHSP